MLSGTLLTKVTLQHILYPSGGNTYESDTKNETVYGAKPPLNIYAYDSGNNGELDSSINVL